MPGQYNPESILEEQFESQRQQIQKQFQFQWDEVNNRARAGLYESQKARDGDFFKIHSEAAQVLGEFDQKVEQGMGQLTQIDKLREMGAFETDEDADRAKWNLVLPPGTKSGMSMFQQQADPQDELRDNLATQTRLMDELDELVPHKGRHYLTKRDDKGYPTGEPDLKEPASPEHIQTWQASKNALYAMEQEQQSITGGMAEAGQPDPFYLQEMGLDQRRKGFFKKWLSETGFRMRGGTLEGLKRVRETGGTFAQKVQQDIAPSRTQARTQAPRTKKKLTKKVAMNYRLQYDNMQDAMAAARADGYTE